MDDEPAIEPASAAEWRRWLEENHQRQRAAWVVLLKKAAGPAGITYDESVEEALCFGWVDGKIRSRDARSYAIRFTPRRPGSNWSESNRERVRRLIGAGRMTPQGAAVLPPDLD